MIGIIILIVAIGLLIWHQIDGSWDTDAHMIVGFVVLGLYALFLLGTIGCQISNITSLDLQQQRITLYQKQADDISKNIIDTLDKYPDYEKKLIRSAINKNSILSMPPTSKYSETLIMNCNERNSALKKVYKTKDELLKLKNDIKINHKLGNVFFCYLVPEK